MGAPSQPDSQTFLSDARVGFGFLPPNNASLRQASGFVYASRGGGGEGRGRVRERRSLARSLQAGTERGGGFGEGCWEQTAQSQRAALPRRSWCPDVDGAGPFVRLLGPPPWNRGPGAHFQSGPVPSTQAELIKHSLPFCKEMESNLLLEQLVLTAPPPPPVPSSLLLLIPGLHHLRICFPSISWP